MTSITPNNRSSQWSIKIHTNLSTKPWVAENDIKAGFVCSDGLSISAETIFEDLKLVYPDLQSCPDGFNLTLWRELDDGSLAFTSISDREEFKMKKLLLGLILHNKDHSSCKKLTNVAEHVQAGCAKVPTLDFDSEKNGYLPGNLNYPIPSARSSRPSSPSKKRKLTEDSSSCPSTPNSGAVWRAQNEESRELVQGLGVNTKSFEQEIKSRYKECAITRTHSRWDDLKCGPGYVAAHIVPQKFWFSYPDSRPSSDFSNYPFNVIPSRTTDEAGLRKRMNSTWNPKNGLLLRADIHEMFDRRMIAIHPVTLRIRLFAPMPVAMEYHGTQVQFEVCPDMGALAHHYSQCVIENVAAAFTSESRYAVPGNWRQGIGAILQPSLVNPNVQRVKEQGTGQGTGQGTDGCTDEDGYYLEDILTKEREEQIVSWLERFNE